MVQNQKDRSVRDAETRTPDRLAYSIREVAGALGISVGLVRLEIGRNSLQAVRLGGRVMITAEELHRYLVRSGQPVALEQ
jgi:excisionase family DNA binding protein